MLGDYFNSFMRQYFKNFEYEPFLLKIVNDIRRMVINTRIFLHVNNSTEIKILFSKVTLLENQLRKKNTWMF